MARLRRLVQKYNGRIRVYSFAVSDRDAAAADQISCCSSNRRRFVVGFPHRRYDDVVSFRSSARSRQCYDWSSSTTGTPKKVKTRDFLDRTENKGFDFSSSSSSSVASSVGSNEIEVCSSSSRVSIASCSPTKNDEIDGYMHSNEAIASPEFRIWSPTPPHQQDPRSPDFRVWSPTPDSDWD